MARPPTMNSDDESFLRRRSCFTAFFGPFRPVFGGHTLREAGTSALMPTPVLLLTRLASAVFLLASFIYYLVDGVYSFRFYSSWSHLGLGLSFALLTSLSIVSMARPSGSDAGAPVGKPSTVAFFAVFFFQVFASAALFLDPVYWALLYDPPAKFHQIAQHAINLVLVLVDIFLALRMEFKLVYSSMFVLYTLVYVGFAWILYAVQNRFPYNFLDFRDKSAGTVVAYYLGVFAWGVVAALLMFSISRVCRLSCVKRDRDRPVTEDESDFA